VNPKAVRFDRISYLDILTKELHVMDTTAISLCMDNKLPLIVFSLEQEGTMEAALRGEPVGTVVY
jgi:uridylate kinase